MTDQEIWNKQNYDGLNKAQQKIVDAEEWCEQIYQDIIENKKRLVFISGASSSGKGTNAGILVQYLAKYGIRGLHIEADMYYKGVARIVTEKVVQQPEFKKYASKCADIYNALLSVNKYDRLENKFKKENIAPMLQKLSAIVGKEDAPALIRALYDQHLNINFDEPTTNKFGDLEKDLKALLNGEKVMLSKYSFDFSECYEDESQVRDGNDYDVLIVEGLYMLRPEILHGFSPKEVATAFIDCDTPTMLSRRFYRDIQLARTKMLPEQTITLALKKVIPAYYAYILPTKSKAQHIHYASLTPKEVELRRVSSQVKYSITNEQYNNVLSSGFFNTSGGLQKDVFFTDAKGRKPFEIRLRSVDGFVNSLTFKMGRNTTNRHIDNYNLRDIFDRDDLDMHEFCQAMIDCGFKYDYTLTKYRQSFAVQGSDNVFTINLDDLGKFGKYLEIDNASFFDLKRMEKKFGLEGKFTSSYVDKLKEIQAMEESQES